MINTIIFKGKKITWNYSIVPYLECPTYPLQKEWENDPDIRKDKCYTSRCIYSKKNDREISQSIASIMNKV